jgi:hypothetical protein
MRFLGNVVGWIVICAVFAGVAGFILSIVEPPPPPPPNAPQAPRDSHLMYGAKASVTGAVIGFFIGIFGPRLYNEDEPVPESANKPKDKKAEKSP